jgi:hypothetical protein
MRQKRKDSEEKREKMGAIGESAAEEKKDAHQTGMRIRRERT